jgi:hypothetical protein
LEFSVEPLTLFCHAHDMPNRAFHIGVARATRFFQCITTTFRKFNFPRLLVISDANWQKESGMMLVPASAMCVCYQSGSPRRIFHTRDLFGGLVCYFQLDVSSGWMTENQDHWQVPHELAEEITKAGSRFD